MTRKTVKIASLLCAAMLVLNVLGALLNMGLQSLLESGFSLPTGLLLCLSLILPAAVLLIDGIKQAKKGGGALQPVLWAATLVLGLVWALKSLATYILNQLWLMALNNGQPVLGMPIDRLASILSIINFVGMLLMVVVAILLLILLVISVLVSKQKWLQLKAGMCNLCAAVTILVPSFFSVVQLILNRVFVSQGMDVYRTFLTVYGIATIVIELLLTLLLAALVLILGLVYKKQTQPMQESEQPIDEQQADVAIDLPAGVRPE